MHLSLGGWWLDSGGDIRCAWVLAGFLSTIRRILSVLVPSNSLEVLLHQSITVLSSALAYSASRLYVHIKQVEIPRIVTSKMLEQAYR